MAKIIYLFFYQMFNVFIERPSHMEAQNPWIITLLLSDLLCGHVTCPFMA